MARRIALWEPQWSSTPLRSLEPGFLSFTLDTSLVLGGRWWGASRKMHRGVSVDHVEPLDLGHPLLLRYAKALAPASLRVGGTEADRVRYAVGSDRIAPESSHEYHMEKGPWKALHRLVRLAGLELVFTLSAGKSDRNVQGHWLDDNAFRLMDYSIKKGFPVAAWELGNEVNGFPFLHGLSHGVSVRQYSDDLQRLARLIRSLGTSGLVAGPSSAVWPVIGEPNPFIPGLCRGPAGQDLQILTWHYYPQQSRHGPVATRRASARGMLDPRKLDGVLRWTRMTARALADLPHRNVKNWVTETAHALYGGEPGLSDTFVSTLWWLDELGLFAREGVDKVFRQSLIGARYGLLDQKTWAPRPDFWASFLWSKLMGTEVYPQPFQTDPRVRVYLHSNADGRHACLLVLNLHQRKTISLQWRHRPHGLWCLTGDRGLRSKVLLVNGVPASEALIDDWGKKRLKRAYGVGSLDRTNRLPPLSATFFEVNLTDSASIPHSE